MSDEIELAEIELAEIDLAKLEPVIIVGYNDDEFDDED